MTSVKIIVQGYASKTKNIATSNCVLIIENNTKIIIDPGMDRPELISGLRKLKLNPQDIDYVVQSHGHIDHSGLVGIFENAILLDNADQYTFEGGFKSHSGKVPGTNVQILRMPGHDPYHCSVLAETNEGFVAVAADVFWWWDEEEQKTDYDSLMSRIDPYVKNELDLKESREKILKIADYIIPGHGKMFKVERR